MSEETKNPNKPDELVRLALKRFKESAEAESEKRSLFIEDIRFAVLGEQWGQAEKELRKGRPCLTENRIPTFIAQVVGDQRQNRPRIKVRPVDSKGDPAVATILTGVIKNIENVSRAESIRDHAFKQAVTGGWGYYAIHTRYCDEMSFDQEMYHRFIPNPLSVYDDPHAKLPDRSDRKWLIVTESLSKTEFQERWPKAKTDGFEEGQGDLEWFTDDSVRIGEYWYVEPEKVNLALLSNGLTIKKKDWKEGVTDSNAGEVITIVKERTSEVNKVYSCIISGGEILEGPTEWLGKYIPFIYVPGKEDNIEGKTYTTSLVRWAKDPQRMHNYWLSATTEIIALQPKAPWLVEEKQIEGKEAMWAQANTSNLAYLVYKNTGAPIPQRQTVNNLPQGAFTMMQSSVDGIKATMGLFDASIGAKGNETSGKAIIARQREGDVATFEFIDNLATRSIPFEGRILVDLIPKIYDTAQIIRIINPDDSEKFVMVNQALTGDNVKTYGVDKKANEGTIYDLTAGKYDVVIESGPSYSTQRAEAAENMVNMIQAAPNLLGTIGDILFKNLDWPGAQEASARLRKTLPPGLAEPQEGEPPTPPPQPPPPTPQDMLEAKKLELEAEKINVDKMKLLLDGEDRDKRTRQIVLDTIQEIYMHNGMNNDMGGMMGARG